VQTKTSFENSKIFNNLKLRIRPNERWSTRLRNRPGATLELCAKKWVIYGAIFMLHKIFLRRKKEKAFYFRDIFFPESEPNRG
jgi:hypothetical protein